MEHQEPRTYTLRTVAGALAVPVVFVVNLMFWKLILMFGQFGLNSAFPGMFGPPDYDFSDIGVFIYQLFFDILPAGAAMATAAWFAAIFFRRARLGYRIGFGLVVVLYAASAVTVTWTMIQGSASIPWRQLIVRWVEAALVAGIARLADREISNLRALSAAR